MIDIALAPAGSNKGHGLSIRQRRLKMYDQRPICSYCGCRVKLRGRPRWERATVDHVEPRSKGGTNAWRNLRLACSLCNSCKKDRSPRQWALDILAPVRTTVGIRRVLITLLLKWI